MAKCTKSRRNTFYILLGSLNQRIKKGGTEESEPVYSIFLAYFGHFLIELSHTNGHINETQSPRL